VSVGQSTAPEKESWMDREEELGLAKDAKIIHEAGLNTLSLG